MRESEITLFADGVVGLVGGFMVIDVLIGGNGTFDSLASDMADEVDIIRVRDLDLGRAIPDLKEVGAEDVGVFERNELTLPTEFAPDSLPPLLPRCPRPAFCVSSSDEITESRDVAGKGRPPLPLLSDVTDESVLAEKIGDEPMPEEPDAEDDDSRAVEIPCTATVPWGAESGILTDNDGVPFETDETRGLPAKLNEDGGGGGPMSDFASSMTTSRFPSNSGESGNE